MDEMISRSAAINVVLQAAQKTPSRFYGSVDAMMGYRAALLLIYHELKEISPAEQLSSCNHEKGGQPEPEEPFEKCSNCVHDDDSLDICVLRQCKHAIAETVECFEPKQPKRKRGKWVDETLEPFGLVFHPYKCNQCGEHSETDSNFCPNCGARMEGE